MEGVAVGQHRNRREQAPRRTPADSGGEEKDAPGKEQDGEAHDDFLGGGETGDLGYVEKGQVEQHIVVARHEIEARGLAVADKLGKPGVIDVAWKVASLDAAVPKAGDEQEDRNREDQDCT
jgi:hypothetical protein